MLIQERGIRFERKGEKAPRDLVRERKGICGSNVVHHGSHLTPHFVGVFANDRLPFKDAP